MTPCSRLVAVTTTSSRVWATAGPVPTKAAETASGKISRALGLAPNTFAIVVSSYGLEQCGVAIYRPTCSFFYKKASRFLYIASQYTPDLI